MSDACLMHACEGIQVKGIAKKGIAKKGIAKNGIAKKRLAKVDRTLYIEGCKMFDCDETHQWMRHHHRQSVLANT